MTDLTKYSVPLLYTRNKNTSYRKSIVECSTALLVFLKNNNLISKEPIDENGNLKMDFVIKESDLSKEGIELFKKAVPAWLNGLDRGKSPEDMSSLDKALTVIKTTKTPSTKG